MCKLNATLVFAMAFVLVAPCIVLAENANFNYGSIKYKYKPQKDDGVSSATKRDAASGLPTGKRMHEPITNLPSNQSIGTSTTATGRARLQH